METLFKLICLGLCLGYSYCSLEMSLLQSHDPNTVPKNADGTPVEVSVGFWITDIVYANENTNEVDVVVWFYKSWTDPSLSWDPADYNGVSMAYLDESNPVWLPSIVPYGLTKPLENNFKSNLVVYSSGGVLHMPSHRMSLMCDVSGMRSSSGATCNVTVGDWVHHAGLVDVKANEPQVVLSDYFAGSKYEIISSNLTRVSKHYACCPEEYPYINVSFTFKAK